MKRLWPMLSIIVLLLTVALSFGAAAQVAGSAVANPPAPGPGSLSAAQARQALDVLNDPQKRAQLAATLEAIIRAEPAAAPTPAPAAAGTTKAGAAPPAPAKPAAQASNVRLEPNSLGAALLVSASGFAGQFWTHAIRTVQTVQSLSLLWGWAVVMATNPLAQTLLREAAWRVAVAFAIGLAVEWGIERLLLSPIRILEERSPDGASERPSPLDESGESRAEAGESEPPRSHRVAAATLLKRLPLVLLRFLLDLLPVIAFLITGHIVAASPVGGSQQTQLIILAMVDAYVIVGAVMCFSRMMLSPQRKRLRLLRISDANAQWATRWTRRIAVVAVFGYAIAEVGLLLGMSALAHDGVLKFAGLIIHLSLVVMVLQKRRTVARLLRAPPGETGVFARMRNAVAPIWHWVAVFFLIAIWIVAAAEIRNGFAAVLRYFVEIVLVATAARLLLIVLLGSLDRAMRPRPELLERYPGLELRLKAYHPLLHGIARTIVYCLAAFVLLELSGVALAAWFTGSLLGRRLIAGLGTMVLTLLLALAVWEIANAAIESHIARLTRAQQVARATRLRTLMPLLRTTLLVVILVIAGLTVLSEIGINIAPLLAGAGIIGVAIGFGSQKLVQDLITGLFLLLENAMQVGDQVTVSGLSGTVEHLSVRTIRLRAGDGSVHLIPFSAVTSVTNTNRGLGNAAVSVTIAFSEDTDRATTTLKEIAAGMRKEADYATRMLSDLQVWGVDKVDGASATITGQIPCTDTGRWPVQREFNRRVKMRFQEQGISLWNPAQTYVVPVVAGSDRPTLSGPREEAAE